MKPLETGAVTGESNILLQDRLHLSVILVDEFFYVGPDASAVEFRALALWFLDMPRLAFSVALKGTRGPRSVSTLGQHLVSATAIHGSAADSHVCEAMLPKSNRV